MPQEHDSKQRTIRYSKKELLSLKDTHCINDLLDTSSLISPSPLRTRKTGRKGGTFTVMDVKCTPKLELLVVSCRPYYLPREIPCIICVIVYLPEGHHTPSEDIIIDTVSNLQQDKPEAAIIVLGDLNQEQFRVAWGMTAPLREKGILDMIGSR